MFNKIAIAGLAVALLFGAMPAQAGISGNGLTTNGLTTNALTENGLSQNGGTQRMQVIAVELPATR